MARRTVPEINAGSMADIAFLLLIFFLVATRMNVDTGISIKLPPWAPDSTSVNEKIKDRNIFQILINNKNQLAIEGNLSEIADLKQKTIAFYQNPSANENLSEFEKVSDKIEQEKIKKDTDKMLNWQKVLNTFGDINISKGIVSLQNDRGTQYSKYIDVQNELVAAINQMRNELAIQTFGKYYENCNSEQQTMLQLVYPLSISEAEPRSIEKTN